MSTHTSGPWVASLNSSAVGKTAANGSMDLIADLSSSCFRENVKADAEFIVRACNAHDELVAALKRFMMAADFGTIFSTNEQLIDASNSIELPMMLREQASCFLQARNAIVSATGVTK